MRHINDITEVVECQVRYQEWQVVNLILASEFLLYNDEIVDTRGSDWLY